MFAHDPICYQDIELAQKRISVKRLDLIHPTICGNKWFKLQPNLQAAEQAGKSTIISFGGAYSNHIHALAHACAERGLHSVGIIRGQELAQRPLNPTLQDALDVGMQLQFISRQAYRQKHTQDYLNALQDAYPDAYIVPEGGSNRLAVTACEAILSADDVQNFDVIVCAVGTGATFAGIVNASDAKRQQVLGFAALNSNHLSHSIQAWLKDQRRNWQIQADVTFGGYGKIAAPLQDLIDACAQQHLPLEPVYTAKALYGLKQHLQRNAIAAEQRILFVHTGGLQGARGFNRSETTEMC